MNQAELRQMAEVRIHDAKVLIEAGRWEFAYYSAGYSVECALKSCVLARMILTGWVFNEENKKVDDCRVHDFKKLIQIAGLRDELNGRLTAGASSEDEFVANWNTVDNWKVTSRYEAKTEDEAKKLYAAITDEPDGVLRWIRNYW